MNRQTKNNKFFKLIAAIFFILLTLQSCGPDLQKSYIHLQNGIDLVFQAQHQQAIVELDKALKYNPESFEAYYYRGAAKRNSGDMEGAYDDFQQAVEINPLYAEPYFALALLYEYRNDKDMACYFYLKAEELGMLNITDYTRWCK
ncbi:MAG: tetratricopeptide repeat protein [Bacteroidales bacterium]|jgi:Tfp pilus assembly protein PilF|nr:tetratricopeptide repeat protein [Bacteroidales bacterium]MDY0370717.1 tetratricopeptide repeat protein [Bacteroidales bacterium]